VRCEFLFAFLIGKDQGLARRVVELGCTSRMFFKIIGLVLQLYLLRFLDRRQRPGPKGPVKSPSFRGLKPPAPSEISDLQL
jgi:hypothetical protein